jgi:hypothetical protein
VRGTHIETDIGARGYFSIHVPASENRICDLFEFGAAGLKAAIPELKARQGSGARKTHKDHNLSSR